MEEQTNVPESGTQEKPPAQGEQYFMAAFKLAEWIPKQYKNLAAQYKSVEIWKELYLCACDGVPVEKAAEAMQKNPPDGALAFVRQKHLENVLFRSYEQELSSIKETTSSLEQEVRTMSQTLTHLAEHVPQLDAMFPETDVPESGTQQDSAQTVPPVNTPEKKAETVEEAEKNKPGDGRIEKKEHPALSGMQGFGIWKKIKQKKDNISAYLEKCLKEGYSSEQLEYLLDCMEDGMSIPELERIASPQLPVDMMRRLRMMEERKENKEDGK